MKIKFELGKHNLTYIGYFTHLLNLIYDYLESDLVDNSRYEHLKGLCKKMAFLHGDGTERGKEEHQFDENSDALEELLNMMIKDTSLRLDVLVYTAMLVCKNSKDYIVNYKCVAMAQEVNKVAKHEMKGVPNWKKVYAVNAAKASIKREAVADYNRTLRLMQHYYVHHPIGDLYHEKLKELANY